MSRAVLCILVLFACVSRISAQTVTAGPIGDVDPQTGYFAQSISVGNNSATNYPGIRVLILDLPKDTETNIVRVANAFGTTTFGTTNDVPYFDSGPLPSGVGINFTVQYYISNRRTKPTPTFAVIVQTPPQLQLAAAFVVNTNATKFTNGIFYAEFLTQRDRIYYIQYSGSLTATNWLTSQPGLVGNGSGVQWFDDGPPRTESKPTAVGQRFYRVVTLPN
jgi:hypothetical protein